MLHGFAERSDFAIGVEILEVRGVVAVLQIFSDAPIAHTDDITGGKVHQRSVIAGANKMQEMFGGVDIGRNGIAHIGIEIGQSGPVYDKIKRFREPSAYALFSAEPGLAYIPFNHVYVLA